MLISQQVAVRFGTIIQTFSGTQNGASIDLKGLNRPESVALLFVGQFPASATLSLKVQESDDNSTWSDVSGTTVALTTASCDDKVLVGTLRTRGRKRYLRAVTATPTNSPVGCTLWLAMGQAKKPATQSETVMFAV